MERIMMDLSSVNTRRGGNTDLACDNYRSFPTTMKSGDAPNSHAPMSSLSHLLIDRTAGSYGSNRPPFSVYSSLPPSFASLHAMFSPPPPQSQQPPSLIPHVQPSPPLLPLPLPSHISISATLPVSISKAGGATGTRPSNQRKKQKPKKKETPQPWASVVSCVYQAKYEAKKPLRKPCTSSSEYELEGDQEMDSVYSLSPPPSSLPMPSYALMKPRGATAPSCAAQAMV